MHGSVSEANTMADKLPKVAAVMLADGRREMVLRARQSFRSQTYENKVLEIWDTGNPHLQLSELWTSEIHTWAHNVPPRSVGRLRNEANESVEADIICHFDSDDISHPNRIAEQVALLEASGADCVGYNECLFWRTIINARETKPWTPQSGYSEAVIEHDGEAWMYTNKDRRMAIGSSFCYWRRAWEMHPFPDLHRGEDRAWRANVNCVGFRAFGECERHEPSKEHEPMMICSIHGGNTCSYDYERVLQASPNWKRVPQWDDHCRMVMSL